MGINPKHYLERGVAQNGHPFLEKFRSLLARTPEMLTCKPKKNPTTTKFKDFTLIYNPSTSRNNIALLKVNLQNL